MQVTKENRDDLNASIKIQVEKADYEPHVTKKLKEYKKQANMPGFRPGMVPMGMIKRMYYKQILLEEINRIVSESLSKFIDEEELNILGEPLPDTEQQKTIDFDSQENFEFIFDVAIAPEIEADITNKDEFPYYLIDADKDLIDKHADSYTSQFGEMAQGEQVEEEDVIKGNLSQLSQEGDVVEDGITAENSSLSMRVIKDEDIRNQLTGSKVGDVVQLDLKKAYPNDTELAQILGIEKEKIDEQSMNFQLTIEEINQWKKAEITQELFDKAFGEGEITSEEEFRNRLKEEIEKAYAQNSDYKLFIDTKAKMVESVKAELPEAFIKRWLLATNKGKLTEEELEKDFPKVKDDLKWQLIQDTLIKKFDLKVEPEEVEELAKQQVLMQFRQYGMGNVPEEHLGNYAKEMLKKDPERRRLYEQKFQEKITHLVKETASLKEKKIKEDEFSKLFED